MQYSPLLTQTAAGASEPPSETDIRKPEMIATPYGYVTATLMGRTSQIENVIVTYHDVGMNHSLCWERFLKHPKLEAIFSAFCVIHIDAPGHQPKDAPLSTYPKFEELAEQLHTVLDHYKVKYFIGLGVGAGASVLVQYALLHEARVRGLVLISLVGESVGIGERLADMVGSLVTDHSHSMISRWFDSHWQHAHKAEVSEWISHASSLEQHNVANFIRSIQGRPSLHCQLKKLSCRMLCFVGRGSSAHEQQLDSYGQLSVHSAALIELDSGGVLLHIEEPEKMTTPLALFVDGFGIMHTVQT